MIINRIKSVVLAAAFAGVVPAAYAQLNEVKKPFATSFVAPAVVESTYSVFPQISTSMRSKPMMPANPSRPIRQGQPNSLSPTVTQLDPRAQLGSSLFPGIGATGFVPADPCLAVGPNQIVEVVNSDVAFFNKTTGAKTFQQSMEGASGFFSGAGAGNFVFDPKVFYDQIHGRFVVVALDVDFNNPASAFLIAVSDDNNPSGTWFKYKIDNMIDENSTKYWLDYPGWGYNKDAFVACGNMFGFTNGGLGVQFVVMPSAPMLTGAAVTVSKFRDDAEFTGQIARTFDATTAPVFALCASTTSSLKAYAFTNLTSGTVTMTSASVPVPAFSTNVGLAQSKGGASLDTIGVRMMNACARNGKLYGAHTVAVSGSDSRPMIRWYEVNLGTWPTSGTPTASQTGNIVPPSGQNYFIPDITCNKLGDVSVVFTRSSSSIAADMVVAARKKTDPAGSMGAPAQLASSQGTYSGQGNRWGDYAGSQPDPSDDVTFWGVMMNIRNDGNWGTTILSWTVSTAAGGGGGGLGGVAPSAVAVYQGVLSSGNLASLANNDANMYSISSAQDVSVGQVAGAEMTFTIGQIGSQTQSLQLSTATSSKPYVGGTGMIYFYNWNTNTYEFIMSYRMMEILTTTNTSVITANISKYINAAKQVKVVVRGYSPNLRNGTPPQSFVFNIDSARLSAPAKP